MKVYSFFVAIVVGLGTTWMGVMTNKEMRKQNKNDIQEMGNPEKRGDNKKLHSNNNNGGSWKVV